MNTKNFENTMQKAELFKAQRIILSTLDLAKKIAEKHALTEDNAYYRRTKGVYKALEDWRPVDEEWLSGMAVVAEVLFPDPQDYNEFIFALPTAYTFEEWAEIVERCANDHDWTGEYAMSHWDMKIDIARRNGEWPCGRDPRFAPIEVMQDEDPFKMNRFGGSDWQHDGFIAHPPF